MSRGSRGASPLSPESFGLNWPAEEHVARDDGLGSLAGQLPGVGSTGLPWFVFESG